MGYGVLGAGCGVSGAGYGVWGIGSGVWGIGCGVWGIGCGVWYSGVWFGAMRWMMIVLLASLAGLLLAAAGVARHIWLQRSRLRSNPEAGPGLGKGGKGGPDGDEIDPEIGL